MNFRKKTKSIKSQFWKKPKSDFGKNRKSQKVIFQKPKSQKVNLEKNEKPKSQFGKTKSQKVNFGKTKKKPKK